MPITNGEPAPETLLETAIDLGKSAGTQLAESDTAMRQRSLHELIMVSCRPVLPRSNRSTSAMR